MAFQKIGILENWNNEKPRINLKNYFLINIIPIWKNDMPLALKMFKAGKLKLFPTFGKPKAKKRAAEGLQ
jgi:hypothetical protein